MSTKEKIVAKIADIGADVCAYVRSQKEVWREIYAIADVLRKRTGYESAISYRGYWFPQLPDVAKKKCDFFVDLEKGELVSVEDFTDFIWRGCPPEEMQIPSEELVYPLALHLDQFDSAFVLAVLRQAIKKRERPSAWMDPESARWCCYDVRTEKRPFFGMVLLVFAYPD